MIATADKPAIQTAAVVARESRQAARWLRLARSRCSSVATMSTGLFKLSHPRRPESQALAKPLCLSGDHRDVGQLDFAPRLCGLCGHQVLDSLHDLLFHGEDLPIDLPPIERLLHRCALRISLSIHGLTCIA